MPVVAIDDQVTPSVDEIQFRTLPPSPVNVNKVLLIPVQTVLLVMTAPGIVGANVVTVIVSLRLAQPFISLAVINPPALPAVTLMILLLLPELIIHVGGTVQ